MKNFIRYRVLWLLPLAMSTTHAENLSDVYQLAASSDPQIAAARSDRDIAREANPRALSNLLPQINLQAGLAFSDQQVKSSANPFSTSTNGLSKNISLQLTQSVYRHENYVRLKQADREVAQADAVYRNAEQQLVLRVADAYFAVLAGQTEVSFAEAEKAAISRQLEQTRQRFKVGATASTDVQEAQARYDLAVAQEIAATAQLEANKDALIELTGQRIGNLQDLNVNMALVSPTPATPQEWIATAEQQNPLLLAAGLGASISRLRLEAANAAYYPTVEAFASYGINDTSDFQFGSRTNEARIGLTVNVPIYLGGSRGSGVRSADAQYHRSLSQLQVQKRQVERQARQAFRGVTTAIRRAEALSQAVKSSSVALDATQAGFNAGTRTTVDVLNARRELFRARRDYTQSRYAYVLQLLNLKYLAGILGAQDLAELDQQLGF